MKIRERILLFLSRAPESNDYSLSKSKITIENALDLLTRVIPSFNSIVSGKRIIDFGCGLGYQSIALVEKYNCSVVGIDSNRKTLRKAIDNAKTHNISPQDLSFVEGVSADMMNSLRCRNIPK